MAIELRNQKKHHSMQVPTDQKQLKVGDMIAGRFQLLEKIGQGSFGILFKTKNMETGDILATKFEKRDESSSVVNLLVREIKVLMEIKGLHGFPQISFYGRDECYNYFMIDYLGYNLESLLRKCNGKLSIQSVVHIALQLINRIEQFHNKNLIHRDIKPENFVIGNEHVSTIYMIDFGLSKYYKDGSGKHIPAMDKKGLIGTARYASLNAHFGKEQSRRDDLEGIGYVIIYLAKGKLPWMNLMVDDKQEKYKKIMEIKIETSLESLCEHLPKCFLKYFQYVKSLNFTDGPNYQHIKQLFNTYLQEIEINEVFPGFEWERLNELRSKKAQVQQKQKSKQVVELYFEDLDHQQFQSGSPTNSPLRKQIQKKLTLQVPQQRVNSFLNVPGISGKRECDSPDKLSRNSRNISMNSSRKNNYQYSNLVVAGEEYKQQFKIQPVKMMNPDMKRRESKSRTTVQKQLKNQNFFIKEAAATKKEGMDEEIEDEFLEYDNLHEIADDDDLNLNFSNIQVKHQHKIGSILNLNIES